MATVHKEGHKRGQIIRDQKGVRIKSETRMAQKRRFIDYNELTEKQQLRQILILANAIRAGDFSKRIPLCEEGVVGDIGAALNDIAEINENLAAELTRVSHIV